MAKTQKLSAGEKAAHISGKYSTRNKIIGGLFLISVAVLTWWLSRSDKGNSKTQEVKEQKVDSGLINNYNAGGYLKVENNYNTTIPKDTTNPVDKNQKTVYKETSAKEPKPQSKNQIINNAPNQGVQINENNGTIIVPKPLQRDFSESEARNILKDYPANFPIEIWLKGTNKESMSLFNQVTQAVKSLGYNNISTNIIGVYATTALIEKDFDYGLENGRFVFSIYPQQ